MSWGEHGYVEEDDDSLYFWSAKRLWQLAASEPVIHISLDKFDWTNDNFQFNLPTDTLYWRDIGDQVKTNSGRRFELSDHHQRRRQRDGRYAPHLEGFTFSICRPFLPCALP